MRIAWVRVQLDHLGYPLYFAYVTGVWHVGGAAAIVAPGFARLKEWAYAGAFFTWSGAVASHLLAGDGVEVWLPPLVFLMFGIASWAVRPPDRPLPNAGLAPKPTLRLGRSDRTPQSCVCRFVFDVAVGQCDVLPTGS